MNRPVFDVEVRDNSVDDILYNNEMIGLLASSVRAQSIPVRGTISFNDVSRSSSDRDTSTIDNNWVESRNGSGSESGGSRESDCGSVSELLKIEGSACWDSNIVQDDVCALGDDAGNVTVSCCFASGWGGWCSCSYRTGRTPCGDWNGSTGSNLRLGRLVGWLICWRGWLVCRRGWSSRIGAPNICCVDNRWVVRSH